MTNTGGAGGGRASNIPVGVAPWATKGQGLGPGLAQGQGLGVPVGIAPWATTAYIPSCKPSGSSFSTLQGQGLGQGLAQGQGLGLPRQTMLPPIGDPPAPFLNITPSPRVIPLHKLSP